jgi:hypothetical protein
MNPMLATPPTLLVTAIYYFWHVYNKERLLRRRVLCERVAYMLWVVAHGVSDRASRRPYPVSTWVNDVKRQDARCIEPAA